MGSITTLVRVFLCPCVGPFALVGLTLTWFIWGTKLALHIILHSNQLRLFLRAFLKSALSFVFFCPINFYNLHLKNKDVLQNETLSFISKSHLKTSLFKNACRFFNRNFWVKHLWYSAFQELGRGVKMYPKISQLKQKPTMCKR